MRHAVVEGFENFDHLVFSNLHYIAQCMNLCHFTPIEIIITGKVIQNEVTA